MQHRHCRIVPQFQRIIGSGTGTEEKAVCLPYTLFMAFVTLVCVVVAVPSQIQVAACSHTNVQEMTFDAVAHVS